jgi:hypothetical protein
MPLSPLFHAAQALTASAKPVFKVRLKHAVGSRKLAPTSSQTRQILNSAISPPGRFARFMRTNQHLDAPKIEPHLKVNWKSLALKRQHAVSPKPSVLKSNLFPSQFNAHGQELTYQARLAEFNGAFRDKITKNRTRPPKGILSSNPNAPFLDSAEMRAAKSEITRSNASTYYRILAQDEHGMLGFLSRFAGMPVTGITRNELDGNFGRLLGYVKGGGTQQSHAFL